MVYNRFSTMLTWGGTIGTTGNEGWQCGVHLGLTGSTDGPGLPTHTELLALLNGALTDFHSNPAAWISPGAYLSWAKAAQLDNEGHYTAEPVLANTTAVPGASTAPPRGGPQVACCITLWSGASLGEANYGRFYWPWWEAQVTTGGRVESTPLNAMMTNAMNLVDGINAWAATALTPSTRIVIMSKKGAGASKFPQYVRLGDVKDTQQRRRRQIAEQYASGPVA